MNLFSLFRLFARKPAARPATMRVHTDPPPNRDHYAPKRRREPPPVDLADFLISLTGEKRQRALRLLRQGYGPVLRMAA